MAELELNLLCQSISYKLLFSFSNVSIHKATFIYLFFIFFTYGPLCRRAGNNYFSLWQGTLSLSTKAEMCSKL